MGAALDLPRRVVVAGDFGLVRAGNQVPVEHYGAENCDKFQLVAETGELLAVCHAEGGRVLYDRVFPEVFPAPVEVPGA